MKRAEQILNLLGKPSLPKEVLRKSSSTCEAGEILKEVNVPLGNSITPAGKIEQIPNSGNNIHSKEKITPTDRTPSLEKEVENDLLDKLKHWDEDVERGKALDICCDSSSEISESSEHDVHPDVVLKFARNKVNTLIHDRSLARKAGNIAISRKLSQSIQKYMNIIEVILDTKPKVVSLESNLELLNLTSNQKMIETEQNIGYMPTKKMNCEDKENTSLTKELLNRTTNKNMIETYTFEHNIGDRTTEKMNCGVEENISLSEESLDQVSNIESCLQVYEKQYNEARRNGNKSKAKRKAKRIAQLKTLLQDAKAGKKIEMANIPNPFNSPLKERPNKCENNGNPAKHTLPPATACNALCLEKVPDNSILNHPKTNGPSKKITRKENYCIECKKFVKEFCKHYESVHCDTVEGKKLRSLNQIKDKVQRKKLKTSITDSLRKKGNAEYSKNNRFDSFLLGENDIVIPVKRPTKDVTNHINTVQCAHCEGFYRRRKFSQHLQRCSNYKYFIAQQNKDNDQGQTPLEGNISAIQDHSLPILEGVPGASQQLMESVIKFMKPRAIKDVALKDPLIMKYASEFHKTRRAEFQRGYVSRIITDLAKILIRTQEMEGDKINCLQDVFNPAHFSTLVKVVLEEGGYDESCGTVEKCGLANRLRSHIKGAAETAKQNCLVEEYKEGASEVTSTRKRLKHFLKMLDEKWANEVGRLFDTAVKKSRAESEPKLAAEEDIVKTCQYVTSQYRDVIQRLDKESAGSLEKQQTYNTLLDLLITHIMCLIRRRPVDFKRGLNIHYEKLDLQDDLINEIKNSKHMTLSENDLQLCQKFKLFYVPGKGWKELVPIALTNIMKEAMDAIQRNKVHVGVISNKLFVRAKEMPINPRECLRKVTAKLSLKKPMDLTGNGLRHHAGTFSKLHSSHPNYQDYLASALGHTLHIHRLHYEMPTSIVQKLIVCPVLHSMTQPLSERGQNEGPEPNMAEQRAIQLQNVQSDNLPSQENDSQIISQLQSEQNKTPEKNQLINHSYAADSENDESCGLSSNEECSQPIPCKKKRISRKRWTNEEKLVIYEYFGQNILNKQIPQRSDIQKFYTCNKESFPTRTLDSLVTFIHNKSTRKQKNVTPEVKKFVAETHRRITNVPI